jgi:membrane protease YdiL (CAAX protease family)
MTTETATKPFLSERVWPVVRVVMVQLLLMINIVGNLVAWGVFILVVDVLGWLQIDYRGKTTDEISADGAILVICVVILVNLLLTWLAWRLLERKRARDMLWGFHAGWGRSLLWGLLVGLGEVLLVFGGMAALGLVRVSWGFHPANGRVIVLAIGWAIAASILVPIGEEVLHRGCWFQNVSRGWGTAVATLVSGALFGGLHLANRAPNYWGNQHRSEHRSACSRAAADVLIVVPHRLARRMELFPVLPGRFTQLGRLCGRHGAGRGHAARFTTVGTDPTDRRGFGMEASLVNTVALVIGLMFWLWRRQNGR